MKSKKATIEVQFNWIFVLIVGAIILVFFFGFIQKQRSLSEQKISYTLLSDIESIATGAGVTKGTAQSVKMPKRGIDFECTEECLCTFSSGEINKPFHDKIMFTPTEIYGTELIMWTKEWKFPFRVTNFVYATSPSVMYFLVYSESSTNSVKLMKTVDSLLPEKVQRIKIKFDELPEAKNENYAEVRFIFLDIPDPEAVFDPSFKETKLTALAVYPNTGQLIFYDQLVKNQLTFEAKDSYYFGDASMFGAMFSGDVKLYECNMKTAFERMRYISRVYKERMIFLQASMADSPCAAHYITDPIDAIMSDLTFNINNIETQKGILPVSGMVTARQELEEFNEKLLRGSCPRIY
jgi:hypothetical protein